MVFKKFRNDILPAEERMLSLQPLFNHFFLKNRKTSLAAKEEEEHLENSKSVLLMKDEYSPRDLHAEHALWELAGSSLKQLEKIKAIKQIQQETEPIA